MADSNGRNGTAWKIAGLLIGLIVLMVSVSLNAVQASVAAQTREKVAEYREQQQDHERRLRAVEQAVTDIPWIKRNTDEIKALLERHVRTDRP
jgi:hypothetical protein